MEKWQEIYENTYLPTKAIEKSLGLVKDSLRQKARSIYSDEYRRNRELKVRGWPSDNPMWIPLYENTMMTHLEISEATGMTVKQLFKRISNKYPKSKRIPRNSLNKCAEYKNQRIDAMRESATTIPEGSTPK